MNEIWSITDGKFSGYYNQSINQSINHNIIRVLSLQADNNYPPYQLLRTFMVIYKEYLHFYVKSYPSYTCHRFYAQNSQQPSHV